jgi:hypothetical protein
MQPTGYSSLRQTYKDNLEWWHAQRFHIGTFLTVPGERAKLEELKLALAE